MRTHRVSVVALAVMIMLSTGLAQTSDSQTRWKSETGGLIWSTPAVAGDMVFIGSCAGTFYAKIRPSLKDSGGWSLTRAHLWRGDVLAGNEAGERLAFRLEDGTRQWVHLFKGTIRSIGGSREILYVGTSNGIIYACSPRKTGDSSAGRTEGRGKQSTEIKELRAELEKMLDEDQRLRTQTDDVEKKYGHNSKELAALWAEQERLDKKLLRRLEEIIKQHGWPGKSLVGADASLAAFLILQHADYEYQKKYFPLVKEAERKKEIAPSNVALLEDRILMREGKKQIYGTQLTWNEKTRRFELYPIENEEQVDLLRASVGLQPIAEYLKAFGLKYVPPGKQ